jgi:predicted DNA-binding protein (UPF0251 family)
MRFEEYVSMSVDECEEYGLVDMRTIDQRNIREKLGTGRFGFEHFQKFMQMSK